MKAAIAIIFLLSASTAWTKPVWLEVYTDKSSIKISLSEIELVERAGNQITIFTRNHRVLITLPETEVKLLDADAHRAQSVVTSLVTISKDPDFSETTQEEEVALLREKSENEPNDKLREKYSGAFKAALMIRFAKIWCRSYEVLPVGS